MKKIILFCSLIILLSGYTALAGEKCIMCGMDAQKSDTKFEIQIIKGTEKLPSGKYSLCCLHCFVMLEKNLKKGKIGSIKARDYATKQMIDARKGFYLVESNLNPKGSMKPFMLIFSDKKTAQMYKKTNGGKILTWEKVLDYTKH